VKTKSTPHSTPRSTPTDHRALRIALNAAPHLSRTAAYRLARDPGRWLGLAEPPDRLAAALGILLPQMEKALALAARAGDLADRELAAAERLGARILLEEDADYPQALRQLDAPPPVVYVRGSLHPPEPAGPAVAIVGSRRADSYGEEVADLFARTLAAAGITVVSGFAHGVDAVAHRGALAAEGTTLAVLGCGLDVDYPRGHARLADEIAERGALLSEFPCGLTPRSWHFPVRNRVIAALSAGTLVVQAAPRSGSLVTARQALDLGREVWAVPGRIFDERSLGPNALIRDGATLVQHPRDILETLRPAGPLPDHQPSLFPAAPEAFKEPDSLAGQILAALPPGAVRLPEEIAAGLGTPVDGVLGALLELELGGWTKRHPGGAYGRR